MATTSNLDDPMTDGPGPAVKQERRRANRVQEAVGLNVVRLQDRPAAGDDVFSGSAERAQSDSSELLEKLTSPTHKASISSVGVAFAHDVLLHPGELVTVALKFFPSERIVTVDGRVVSANDAPEISDGDKPTYRIAFDSITTDDREFIELLVSDLSRQRPAMD